ncbi:hypothetical protein C8F04DRAFT_359624 [Mycena alexandri]|uniref:Uncharacterized protein n=1 Tax=Mycena alexandri TaxID=1745969 RepID=A0AAD6X6F3_9AGAR|nr:hypothetical protein C8F04DRAFT_359624 [Mycena alexandri]
MLLLLFLVHVAKKSNIAHANILELRADEADINNSRALFDIIWGCLATVFACTWVAVHQNVPPPDLGWLSLQLRKLKMMLFTVVAPELVVCLAARQFFDARSIAQKFGVPKTHAFFCCMGGFVTEAGHPIAEDDVLSDYIAAIRSIKEADIADKSKGDALSKGVAITQGLWFTVQCLARFHQHLPVTEIEIATLAFAVVSISIRLFWWSKPLDVQQPIVVAGAAGVVPFFPIRDFRAPTRWSGGLSTTSYVSMTRFWVRPATSIAMTTSSTTTTPTMNAKRSPSLKEELRGAILWRYPHYSSLLSTSVPMFYSIIQDNRPVSLNMAILAVELTVGTSFGAIHCVAWNTTFPTISEMWMWRSSSSFVAVYPLLLGSFCALSFFLQGKLRRRSTLDNLFSLVLKTIVFGGVPIYILCRLCLIALPFTTLRALPTGALVDVDWSVYIPHL